MRNTNAILLSFDQFEELFAFHPQNIQQFGHTISTLLNVDIPPKIREIVKPLLKNQRENISSDDLNLLLSPLNLKVLFSLRSDKLSFLNQLKSSIPAIYRKTYELNSLSDTQALEALIEPANKTGNFKSPPFSYSEDAMRVILNSLKNKEHQRIETFQLQLICQYAEEFVIKNNQNNGKEIIVSPDDLGEPKEIYRNHYHNIIDVLTSKEEQYKAQELIEDNLIIGNSRVPLPQEVILQKHKVPEELLQTLVNKRLLRAEQNNVGGISYELSHDTLVEPILKTAEARRTQIEVDRNEKVRVQELKQLKARQIKNRKTITLIIGALIITFLFASFGFVMWQRAEKETKRANVAAENAMKKEKEAKKALEELKTSQYKSYCSEADKYIAQEKYLEACNSLEEAIEFADDSNKVRIRIDSIIAQNQTAFEFNELIAKGEELFVKNCNDAKLLSALSYFYKALELGYNDTEAKRHISLVNDEIKRRLDRYKSNLKSVISTPYPDKNTILNQFIYPALKLSPRDPELLRLKNRYEN